MRTDKKSNPLHLKYKIETESKVSTIMLWEPKVRHPEDATKGLRVFQ